MQKTPKEVAAEVERILRDNGYRLGDLEFWEMVGGRRAEYRFLEGPDVSTLSGPHAVLPGGDD